MSRKYPETAQQALDRNLQQAEQHIAIIQSRLQQARSLTKPNWAHVGDVAHWNELLQQIATIDV